MTQEDFDVLVEYIFNDKIKAVLCNKSAEYAKGNDKLYNFKRSGEIDKVHPLTALRGMDLKHRTSIYDIFEGYVNGKKYSRELIEEKWIDHINYMILSLAIIAEEEEWNIRRSS